MKTKRLKLIVFLLAEVFLFSVFLGRVLFFNPNTAATEVYSRLSEWTSSYTSYDHGWHIDEESFTEDGSVDLLRSPVGFLPKGSYTLTVDYETDSEQKVYPYARDDKDVLIKADKALLTPENNKLQYSFDTIHDIDNFEVRFKYNGEGSFNVYSVCLTQNCRSHLRLLFAFSLLFLAADLGILFRKKIYAERATVLCLLGIIFLASLPLFSPGIYKGDDIVFHISRIEGLYQELQSSVFPVRIFPFWYGGYGYPLPIFYGDLLLYFAAFLRIVGFGLVDAFKGYILFINLLTVLLGYISFRSVFAKNTALLCTAAYVLSAYRFGNLYIRSAAGEFSAMAFFPMVACAVYRICTLEKPDKRQTLHSILLLSFGMTGIIVSHILSTEITVVVLLLICIFTIFRTLKPSALITYCAAAALAFLLSLWFICPFVDSLLSNSILITSGLDDEARLIQDNGAYFLMLFAFWKTPFGNGRPEIDARQALTPGLFLMGIFIIALVLCLLGLGNRKIGFLSFFSALLLFISTDLFPWNALASGSAIGNWLAQVQFPWRYLGPCTVVLSLLAGVLTEYLPTLKRDVLTSHFISFAACVILLSGLGFVSAYTEEGPYAEYNDISEIGSFAVGGAQYLRTGVERQMLKDAGGAIIAENANVVLVSEQGSEIKVECSTENETGIVTVPRLHYKGYRATDTLGISYPIQDGENCCVSFVLPPYYKGIITVQFVPRMLWHIAECISLCTCIALVLLGSFAAFRKKKSQ